MKIVCLVSGGMDSITACVEAYQETGAKPVLLSVVYGQRHRREVESAKKLAEYYGWEHVVYEVPKMPFEKNVWDDLDEMPPTGQTSHTYSPQRNLMLLSIALRYLEYLMKREIDAGGDFVQGFVVTGMHRTDWHPGEPVYPDTRPEFLKALELAANLGSGIVYDGKGEIKIWAPFQYTDKAGVVDVAFELGVPLHLTWTCYRGGDKPCGKCPACRTRLNAFKRAGIPDPLTEEYETLPDDYREWYREWKKNHWTDALSYWLGHAGKEEMVDI